MGKQSGIEWTEATWNPWRGCRKVSPGCAHCYMFRDQERYGRDPTVLVRAKEPTFYAPLKWKEPRTIFTCSWSDWFHEDVPYRWSCDAWDVIARTERHRYLMLTKRHERIAVRPYNHVWVGVSVENQRWHVRAEALRRADVRHRFLSLEPLLGPLTLSAAVLDAVEWVIVGGESGPRARPMDLDWARQLRDQCLEAGVPFFLKQLGGRGDKRGGEKAVLDGGRWTATPWPTAD